MNKILAILMCCAVYAPTDGQRNAQNQSSVFGLPSMRTALTTLGLFTAAVFALNVNSKDNTAVGSLQEKFPKQACDFSEEKKRLAILKIKKRDMCYPRARARASTMELDSSSQALMWILSGTGSNPYNMK